MDIHDSQYTCLLQKSPNQQAGQLQLLLYGAYHTGAFILTGIHYTVINVDGAVVISVASSTRAVEPTHTIL